MTDYNNCLQKTTTENNLQPQIFMYRVSSSSWGNSQNHRITESQNSRGWKGPLWVI